MKWLWDWLLTHLPEEGRTVETVPVAEKESFDNAPVLGYGLFDSDSELVSQPNRRSSGEVYFDWADSVDEGGLRR